MASVPTPIDFGDLLDFRIPDRMKEVYLCAKFAELVKAHGYNHKADLRFSGIGGYQLASTELVGYVILDAGLIMCRALFDLLGIYYSLRDDDLRERKSRKPDDICLSHFRLGAGHLSRITLDQAFHNPSLTPTQMKKPLFKTLRRANKAIGHVTTVRGRELSMDDIIITCHQVLRLLNIHLYQALGRSPVAFDHGVAWYDL
jgi:hypothetical protein